jgi:hypothetical protein
MTKPTNKQAEELAALKARVAELEEKAKPLEPEVSWEERERRRREWENEMHQLREGRMSQAMPPSVVRDMAVLDDNLVKEIALRDARAPTGPSSQGAIPSSQHLSDVRPSGSGTGGWAREIPLGPQPGIHWVDAQLIADDVKQRGKGKP